MDQWQIKTGVNQTPPNGEDIASGSTYLLMLLQCNLSFGTGLIPLVVFPVHDDFSLVLWHG